MKLEPTWELYGKGLTYILYILDYSRICRDGADSFIVFIPQTSRSMYLFKVRGKEQRDKNKEQTIHKTAELI